MSPYTLLAHHITHNGQNTGQEFDGSDSGARPDEAVSWGKIRAGSESVKVGAHDFTPLYVTHRFAGLRGCYPSIPTACCGHIRTTRLSILAPEQNRGTCIQVKKSEVELQCVR